MGLTRRNQLLAKVEATEGTPVSLTASEFIDARSLARTIPQDIEDEVVSSASLSEDLGTVGRGSMGATFNTRYYGLNGTSGLLSTPVVGNAPLDDPLFRACGMRSSLVPYYNVATPPAIATWPGMTVSDGTNTAILAVPMTTSGAQKMYVIAADAGFPSSTSITVNGSATTLAATGIDGYAFAYTPDSSPTAIVNMSSGTWAGGSSDPIVGDIVTNNLNGVNAARGVIVSITGTVLEIEPLLPGRAFLPTETIAGTASGRTNTNTVAAGGQVLNRVPSLTMKVNIGDHAYTGTGMRGNLTVNMEAGKIPLAAYDFSGSRYSSASESPLSGVNSVSASSLARWQSAWASVDGFEIPLSNSSVTLGNTVSLLADAHGSQGVRGSAITARQASITADFDRVNNAIFNFDTRLGNATPISYFTMWGTSTSFATRQAIWAPRCQLYSVDDGDREGKLTAQVTMRPKRRTGSGDDEIYFIFGIW